MYYITLNFTQAAEKISRVLQPNGTAVFREPLGHNPFINLYRKMTPQFRTPDECPLTVDELTGVTRYFEEVEVEYHALTTLAAVALGPRITGERLMRWLHTLDQVLFTLPICQRYAWQVVILARGTRKPGASHP